MNEKVTKALWKIAAREDDVEKRREQKKREEQKAYENSLAEWDKTMQRVRIAYPVIVGMNAATPFRTPDFMVGKPNDKPVVAALKQLGRSVTPFWNQANNKYEIAHQELKQGKLLDDKGVVPSEKTSTVRDLGFSNPEQLEIAANPRTVTKNTRIRLRRQRYEAKHPFLGRFSKARTALEGAKLYKANPGKPEEHLELTHRPRNVPKRIVGGVLNAAPVIIGAELLNWGRGWQLDRYINDLKSQGTELKNQATDIINRANGKAEEINESSYKNSLNNLNSANDLYNFK